MGAISIQEDVYKHVILGKTTVGSVLCVLVLSVDCLAGM